MDITADYHSHTTYSHGTGSIADNARVANEKGFDFLAITDHGARQPLVGVKRRKFDKIRADMNEGQKDFPNLKLLFGVESYIVGESGIIDVTPEDADRLDILIAGYHFMAFPYKPNDFFTITGAALARYCLKPTKAQIERQTRMYINTIKKNKIDIITHPGFRLDIDYIQFGKACADYGTYVELSSRHRTPNAKGLEELLLTDCQFILNSDAHKPQNVGDCEFAKELVERYNVPAERIANIDHKTLTLRSQQNK